MDAQASASASMARPPTHKNHMRWIGRASVGIGIDGKTTDPQKPHEVDRTRRPEPKTTRDQKPQIRPHKNHTRTTRDPQRPKMRKVACRAGFPNIRHTRTTKTTRTTEPCGSSHACGYLGGYSLYFYIILYIYKSKCECECE